MGRQPEVVLRPGAMDRTVAEFGCRIPIRITSDRTGGPTDMAIAVEARDRNGRKLESSGFRTEQLPAVSGSLREMDLQFSRTACDDIAIIVVTSATCTYGDATATSCIDRVVIEDENRTVAYEVDAD